MMGMPKLPLNLQADRANLAKWWVDATCAVHPDCRSHTVGTLSLGKGDLHSASIKQKLNVRSSTEAESVGTHDVVHCVSWTNCFLEAQGCTTDDTIAHLDNKSAILMETNGRVSSGKKSKHIHV